MVGLLAASVGAICIADNFYVYSGGTVAFTAPATDLAGDAIPSLTKVNVYRGGTAEPIHTFDSPAPGASLSFTDNRVSRVGTTVYSVVAENEYGAGATAADSAFVGIYSAPYLEQNQTKVSQVGHGNLQDRRIPIQSTPSIPTAGGFPVLLHLSKHSALTLCANSLFVLLVMLHGGIRDADARSIR